MHIRLDNINIDLTRVNFADWKSEIKHSSWKLPIVNFLEKFCSASDEIELQTSGSTGKAKIIRAKKQHLVNSAKATCEYFNLNNQSVGLLCMNANYIGAQMMLVRAFVSGMNLLTTEPKANPLENINQNIDFTAMVPYQVENCIQTPNKFLHIKNLIIGGGKTCYALQEKLCKMSVNCFETFGMTETYSHIALRQIAPNTQSHFACLKDISIDSTTDNRLVISAPNLEIEKLETNDIVDLIDSKSFKWIGRIDNVINSGGIKTSPELIEEKIQHLFKNDFCIIGLTHKKLGEQIVLVIESIPFETNALNKKIKDILAPYLQPKQIKFVNEFPKTITGKIKRAELKKQFT